MAYPEYRGKPGKVHNTGVAFYGGDGTEFYPLFASTAGITTSGKPVIAQREPFLFRPGAAALANGMVASGTRSSAGTISAAGTAAQTYWGTEVVYAPSRSGKIDGIAASGVVSGQITIGLKSAASTADAKVTARIRNQSGTWTTCLALSGTVIACSTAEIFRTYDIPYLYTTADFNQVPFGFAIGVESNLAGTATIARIMESSYIQGEFEPGT